MHEEAGRGQKVPVLVEQRHVSVSCVGAQSSPEMGENEEAFVCRQNWALCVPPEALYEVRRQSRGCTAAGGLTHCQAAEREGVLADKLVVGCGVVVFDDEAHQRQLWHVHVELEVFVPGRVETLKREEEDDFLRRSR